MKRTDYVALLEAADASGSCSHVHWASGPRAGSDEPWDGEPATAPGRPARGLGASCRETAEGCAFVETLRGEPRCVIVGAGHVGAAFAHIAVTLGFRVTVIDERPEFADPARLPGVDEVVCAPYAEALSAVPPYGNTYVVLVTPGHRSDRECVEIALGAPFVYLGMIGSRRKVATVFEWLRERGVEDATLGRIHTPIGLSIGAREPAEIAVAIAAEIVQVRASLGASTFDPEVARELQALSGRPDDGAVLTTIVGHGGSVPRGTGSRMLVGAAGLLAGSTGGGRIEVATIERARAMLAEGPETDLVDYDLSDSEGAGLGMVCGGHVRVMFERL